MLKSAFGSITVALAVGALAGCITADRRVENVESICLIDFSTSKEVLLEVNYITDHFHAPSLYDPQCPGKILRPLLPQGASKRDFGELAEQKPALFGGAGLYEYRIKAFGQIVGSAPGDDQIVVFKISKLCDLKTVSIQR